MNVRTTLCLHVLLACLVTVAVAGDLPRDVVVRVVSADALPALAEFWSSPEPEGGATTNTLRARTETMLGEPLSLEVFCTEIVTACEVAWGVTSSTRNGLVALFDVADAPRLTRWAAAASDAILDNTRSSGEPVTRSVERIGEIRCVFLNDGLITLAWFRESWRGRWACANDDDILRNLARRLQKEPDLELTPPQNSERALSHLPDAAVQFFLSPSSDSGPPHPWRVRGAGAGVVRAIEGNLVIDTFRSFAPRDASVQRLYASARSLDALRSADYTGADALLWGETTVFAVPMVRLWLLGRVETMLEALPPSPPNAPAPATRAHRGLLENIRGFLMDREAVSGLGPRCFYAVPRFTFSAPGTPPRIACVFGIEMDNPAHTRDRMIEMEELVLEMAGGTETDTVFGPVDDRSGIRALSHPVTPLRIRPAWRISDGFLVLALHPDSLANANGARGMVGAETLVETHRMNLDRVLPILRAFASALERTTEAAPARLLFGALEPFRALRVNTQKAAGGVRGTWTLTPPEEAR